MASEKINFGGLTGDYTSLEMAQIVIVPIPFDKTTTYLKEWTKGSERGPAAIIEASQFMELYDLETKSHVYESIIHTMDPFSAASSKELVELTDAAVTDFMQKDKFVVILGGEHTVSIGAIAAHARKEPITVVQLDAHTDLRDEFGGDKFSHACVMARAKELGPILQIGIRSSDSTEASNIKLEDIFFAKDIYNKEDWIDKAIKKVGKKAYVTIDLDVFDTGIMPSVSTPEPGGLNYNLVIKFLKKLAESREIVGFDVVELSPTPSNKSPDFLAAKLTYTLLSYIFAVRKKKSPPQKGIIF